MSSWRRRVCQSEQYQTPQLRPRQIVAGQDNCLHLWVRGHQHLLPTDVVAEWESSAALLLLWEVDHGQDWPTMASQRSGALAGFTKKLQQQVGRDDELKAWFTPRELQRPLAPGLADTHQLFWPVRVRPPAPMEPQGWYTDFTARWRAYISALAVPLGVAVTAAAPPASNARRVRRRLTGTTSTTVSPSVADDVGVSSTTPSASAASSGVRARSADSGVGAQAPKRQRTMLSWLHSSTRPGATRSTSLDDSSPTSTAIALRATPPMTKNNMPPAVIPPPPLVVHGRAVAGPPT